MIAKEETIYVFVILFTVEKCVPATCQFAGNNSDINDCRRCNSEYEWSDSDSSISTWKDENLPKKTPGKYTFCYWYRFIPLRFYGAVNG